MSEHKKADIVGSTSKGMTTAEKKARLHPFHRKMWLLAGTGLLFVAIVGTVVYFLAIKPNNKKAAPSITAQTSASTAASPGSQYDRAYAESLQGNTGPLNSLLSQQLKAATTTAQKVQVYNQQIVTALNSQQYDSAISLGMQAYAISPSGQTADLIGNAYEAKGDKTDAKTWFQNAINKLNKNSPTYHTDLGQYTSDLEGVSS